MAVQKKAGFEESLKKLEKYSKEITSDNISLEDAIKSYEKGIMEYNKCKKILDDAKKRVEIIGEE